MCCTKTLKKFIKFLNRLKKIDVWGDNDEDLSDKVKEDMDRIPSQNPYGHIGLIFGGIAFVFGPKYGFIPVITLIFCIITLFTFDKEKEDNPWPFYLGIVLSLLGLSMFIMGQEHQLIL